MPEPDPETALELIEQLERDIQKYKPVLEQHVDGEATQDEAIEALESTEILKQV